MRLLTHTKMLTWASWATLAQVASLSLHSLSQRANAQERKEGLKLLLQLQPKPDGIHADVIVRVVNLSNRTVNMWVSNWIDCNGKPAGVSLEWKYKGDIMNSARAVQGIQTACISDPPGLSEWGPPSDAARAGHKWMHFAPGQYAEVHSTLTTANMLGGKYEVSAVYRALAFTREQQQDIRDGGLETPKGEYKSDSFSFVVPD